MQWFTVTNRDILRIHSESYRRHRNFKYKIQVPPAFHHRTYPSSPPVRNALGIPNAEGLGLHDTDQTSPVSWIVDTALLAPISHTLTVLSAELSDISESHTKDTEQTYPESARVPSGAMSTLKAQAVCPVKEAIVFPGALRMS